jgi:RNA polymerase sigma-70 factor (ECF subfamily)
LRQTRESLTKELQLVKDCQNNERKAQKELFELHSDRMYSVSLRYMSNSSEAEDVVVVAFTKVFKNIKDYKFQGEGKLSAWIRRIVVNECLMLLRSKHNFNLMQNIDDVTTHADLQPLAALHAADIMVMVSRLPIGYRTVFNLHVVEGYNHAEIAKRLSIEEGTSRSQLSKAKDQLKKMLNKENNDYGT